MQLFQKPIFKRVYKKLRDDQRKIVNAEIKKIMENPSIGVEKKQDLKGIFVHKFKMNDRQYLLAYTFDPATLTLVFLGVNENYYKTLKRKLN